MRGNRIIAVAVVALASAGCGARSSVTMPAGAEEDGAGGSGDATVSSTGALASADATSVSASSGAASGGPCAEGELVAPGGRSGRAEASGTDAYFTQDDGRVLRGSLLGGAAPVVVVDGLDAPGDLAIFDGTLYVTDRTRLIALPLDGGSPAKTVYEGPEASAAFIEVDETGIYWLSLGGGIISGVLRHIVEGEPAPTVLVENLAQPGGFALVGDVIVFSAAVIPSASSTELNLVASIPKGGGDVTILASQRQSLGSVFTVGDRIGWIETFSATRDPIGVFTQPIDGSAQPTLLLPAPPDELPLTARSSGSAVVMTTFTDEGGAIYSASLEDPSSRELDRRSEFFIEPAFGDGVIGWSVQPLLDQAETVDLRWICR